MTNYVANRGICGICGKVNFESKRTARAVLRRMLTQGTDRKNRKGNPLRVYGACDPTMFHLGHTSSQSRPNLNDPTLRWLEA
jgi:hypothetical protein